MNGGGRSAKFSYGKKGNASPLMVCYNRAVRFVRYMPLKETMPEEFDWNPQLAQRNI